MSPGGAVITAIVLILLALGVIASIHKYDDLPAPIIKAVVTAACVALISFLLTPIVYRIFTTLVFG